MDQIFLEKNGYMLKWRPQSDTNPTPHSVASDLCLNCLLISLLRVSKTRLNGLKTDYILFDSIKCRLGSITKTRLYDFDPLKPHFYIVKLGFTGVYIIFLISVQNIDCGYSLEPPRRGGSNEYPQYMFWAEIWKISEFLSENFHFFGGKIFNIVE